MFISFVISRVDLPGRHGVGLMGWVKMGIFEYLKNHSTRSSDPDEWNLYHSRYSSGIINDIDHDRDDKQQQAQRTNRLCDNQLTSTLVKIATRDGLNRFHRAIDMKKHHEAVTNKHDYQPDIPVLTDEGHGFPQKRV